VNSTAGVVALTEIIALALESVPKSGIALQI
jgi:hypothetical protein